MELNDFTFKLKRDQLDVIMSHLDKGQHSQVRPVIDFLLQEANRQIGEHAASLQAKKAPVEEGPAPKETMQ